MGSHRRLYQPFNKSNGDALTNFQAHSYNYGVTALLNPRERFGFDFAYNYSDYQANALVCFNDSDTDVACGDKRGKSTANGFNDSKNNLLTWNLYEQHPLRSGCGEVQASIASYPGPGRSDSITSSKRTDTSIPAWQPHRERSVD